MHKRIHFFILMLSLGTLYILSPLSKVKAENVLKVSASILPQKYFIEKIGGHMVDVTVLVPPGANPATYEPKPSQMTRLTRSRIYFAIGVPFEMTWLKRFAAVNPKMTIVHTEKGIEKLRLKGRDHHDIENSSRKVIKDPHIWLSPTLVITQARNILDALIEEDPSRKGLYEGNYSAFTRELEDLDQKIRVILSYRPKGTSFMVYHPSWGYFAKAYGLVQIPIEVEGKEPTPRELKTLITLAKKDDVKVIFVQPQFSTKNARIIANAIGARILVANPLDPDWAENLLEVAKEFKQALR